MSGHRGIRQVEEVLSSTVVSTNAPITRNMQALQLSSRPRKWGFLSSYLVSFTALGKWYLETFDSALECFCCPRSATFFLQLLTWLEASLVSALWPPLQFPYFCCPSSPPTHSQTLQTFVFLVVFHFLSLPFWPHSDHCHCYPTASADSFSVLLAQATLQKQVREEKTLGRNLLKDLTYQHRVKSICWFTG